MSSKMTDEQYSLTIQSYSHLGEYLLAALEMAVADELIDTATYASLIGTSNHVMATMQKLQINAKRERRAAWHQANTEGRPEQEQGPEQEQEGPTTLFEMIDRMVSSAAGGH